MVVEEVEGLCFTGIQVTQAMWVQTPPPKSKQKVN